MTQERKNLLVALRVKRIALFLFGLFLLFSPSQNWYLILHLHRQPLLVQAVDFQIPPPADYPVNFHLQPPPQLTARAVAVIDETSGILIYGQNEEVRLLPASTVKIMTALVTLDSYHPDEILVVKKIDKQGQRMGLIEGEKIKVKDLLYGLLLSSANDAAQVLAQNYPGGEAQFVEAMNKKAQELGLGQSYFANPTGLDSDKNGNLLVNYSFTTARDLARLAGWALQNQLFAKIVATQRIVVTDVSGKIRHEVFNLNRLLDHLWGVRGVKTGWTEEAGECLVAYANRGGRGIITVVLGSKDRFGETTQLINWVFASYQWKKITPSIEVLLPLHKR